MADDIKQLDIFGEEVRPKAKRVQWLRKVFEPEFMF